MRTGKILVTPITHALPGTTKHDRIQRALGSFIKIDTAGQAGGHSYQPVRGLPASIEARKSL